MCSTNVEITLKKDGRWRVCVDFKPLNAAHRALNLRAILMWTMHDFPGYGECSGLATSGYHACPLCGPAINARYSHSLKKVVYEGHKIFLPIDQPLRGGLSW